MEHTVAEGLAESHEIEINGVKYPVVVYEGIVQSRVDRFGHLRLYRQAGRVVVRQVVFHPAGEWERVMLTAAHRALVVMAP